MLKKSKAIALICGGTSIAVTVIFYLLVFDNIFAIPMRWLSMIFLIFAEGIGTIKAINIEKSIFGVTNIITSLFHLGIVLAISIIFVNILPFSIKPYILINILVLCVLLVIDVMIIYFNGHISSRNNVLAENRSVIDSLCIKAKELSIEYKESRYKNELNEISEMLQYSDNSILSGDEAIILDKLEGLQKMLSEDGENISQILSDIKNVIKLRSMKLQSKKRGSY